MLNFYKAIFKKKEASITKFIHIAIVIYYFCMILFNNVQILLNIVVINEFTNSVVKQVHK